MSSLNSSQQAAVNDSTPRKESTARVLFQYPAMCDAGLSSQQIRNPALASAQQRRELGLCHQELVTGSHKRVRRIILKPFKLISSAVKHAVRFCFRGESQEMGAEVFIREHIVDGRIFQTRNEHGAHEDRADGARVKKEEEQDVRRHEIESSTACEVGAQSIESTSDERASSCSSEAMDETSSAGYCREQIVFEGPASSEGLEEFRTDGAESFPKLPEGKDDSSSVSSPPILKCGTDEEEQEAGSESSSADNQLEQNGNSCAVCVAEAARPIIAADEDRNDTDLTLLGQTETEFMEMICSQLPFLDDETSSELREREDSLTAVHSSDEESFWDSDHSSLAGSSSADEEWDEEVVVLRRASRLLPSAESTVVARGCK
ncbi:hypothetical protein FGB62_47g155 [Gracilaria domingensis]|nr:hypothetical protein FGB62_47g155 [Gracilaria domingensis]